MPRIAGIKNGCGIYGVTANHPDYGKRRMAIKKMDPNWVAVQIERKNHPEYKRKAKDHRKSMRDKAIDRLGGKCAKCGEADRDVLQFDHIVPIRRKTNGHGRSGDNMYRVCHMNNPRKKFQVLCGNCHAIKTWTEDATREFLRLVPTLAAVVDAKPEQLSLW